MSLLDEAAELGRITWHSSDEGAGPDVGMTLGLGEGQVLWVGEITKDAHRDGGPDVAALGGDDGWWMIVYRPAREVLARFANAEVARDFVDTLAAAILRDRQSAPTIEWKTAMFDALIARLEAAEGRGRNG